MADFLLTEAVDEDDVVDAAADEGNIFNEGSMTLSDEEFIDDSDVEESLIDYYVLPTFLKIILRLLKNHFLILIVIKNRITIVMKMKLII